MSPRRLAPDPSAGRSVASLRQRQLAGELRVLSAAAFRDLVAAVGLEPAYQQTDVVAAADAVLTDQGALVLNLGPCDPPIRLREVQLGGVAALVGGGSGEVILPLGGGLADPSRRSGAQLLADLLAGRSLALNALGEPTALQPRSELSGHLALAQLAGARLLLHRAIVENGFVAVSSADGLLRTSQGPLLGPLVSALYSCAGAGSIGMTMPGLAQLGLGSPVRVAGAIGTVLGPGSGHNPAVRRLGSGHACAPGACAAVSVELAELDPAELRACFIEGHGAALLLTLAAPVLLLDRTAAARACADAAQLEAPVLDLAIPRRVKPLLRHVSYAELEQGTIALQGQALRCAPAHSPRWAAAAAERLVAQLQSGAFPLQAPLSPLGERSSLVPLDL